MAFFLTDKRVIQPVTTGDVTLAFRQFEGDERGRFAKETAKVANGPKKSMLASLSELGRQAAAVLLVYWVGVLDENGKPIGEPYAPEDGKPLLDEDGEPIAAYVPTMEQCLAFFGHLESIPYWDDHISGYLWPRTQRKGKKGAEVEPEDAEAVTPDFLSGK